MSDSPAVIIYDSNGNPVKLFDLDTAGGTEYNLGVSIRLPFDGGSVPGGTITAPIRIDPIGTTTQPISAVTLPLPTGAATEITLASVLTNTTFTSRINTLGQKTMENSTPVVIASNQTVIPVTIVDGGGTVQKVAYDITDDVIYIGTAAQGTATNATSWLIKRVTLVGGEPTFTEWSSSSAVWDNRTSESYS